MEVAHRVLVQILPKTKLSQKMIEQKKYHPYLAVDFKASDTLLQVGVLSCFT